MKQDEYYKTIIAPHVSEKTSQQADKIHYHTFKVAKTATKIEIKQAVEFLFSVKVSAVKVLNVKGKQKRFGKFQGKRDNWKKAYIRLAPGYDINFTEM